MPVHAELLANLVTGAVTGIAGAITSAIASRGQGTFAGGPLGGAPVAVGAIGTGTSVGPIGSIAGGEFVQAGIGAAIVPAIRRAAPFVIGAVTGAVIDEPFTGQPGQPRGAQTRRQAILAVARANSPGATSKKIIRSAKECGIELAAATFGLNVLDVCFLLAQPPSRRSRGISAADMRRTRSTIRKVSTIQKSLLALSGPIRRRK